MISKVKTKSGYEEIEAFNVQEVTFNIVKFSKVQRNRQLYFYCNDYATFDTETSHYKDIDGWIYQWAFYFHDVYVYGRKPSEFITLLEKMRDRYKLNAYKKIIIYIHNTSYDFAYLKHYLKQYDSNIKVLATDTHSILIVDVFGFRFLCSYKLSNMNLDLFSKTYAKTYRKAIGEICYNIVRYQDEELTDEEWLYMFSDVRSQHEAIGGLLSSMGYEYAYQAPFTSTGFVRNECRKSAEKQKGWRDEFKKAELTLDQYKLARSAFMGGVTIASFAYSGEVVENVDHLDFTSSYPARQMMNYFPNGKFTPYGKIETMSEFQNCIRKYCCLFLLTLENVQIRSGVTAPYIPSSKCIELKNPLRLNGKVVYADRLTIAITEIDFKWIEKQYTFKHLYINKMMIAKRDVAPKWLKAKVMEYYNDKCTLKHGNTDETEEEKEQRIKRYNASKALLNAIYGMSATALVRDKFEFQEDATIERDHEQDEEKELKKYYSSFNSFMPYQLGVWTTAHARDALLTMIEVVGYENFLYCDTDSVFFKRTEENTKRLDQMNEEIRQKALKCGAYVDNDILGYATEEPHIRKFKALHAKCYACEELNEKTGDYDLHVTIAGIPKKSIKWKDGKPILKTNAEELQAIENLEDGFTFRHCGGTRIIYIEDVPQVKTINGHKTELASSAIIENIEKVISDTMYAMGEDYSILHINQTQIL